MDDIEGSWNRQMTGEQVGPWCVDLIAEVNASPTERTDKAQALLGKLRSAARSEKDQEQLLWLMAQAAMLTSRELQFYIDTHELWPGVGGEEKFNRSLLAAKATFASKGTASRPPEKPAADG